MKLIKVQDNTNRPISAVEILFNYIFGRDNPPKKFIPGERYTKGDICYIINDHGNVEIYTCEIPGRYDKINGGWRSEDISGTVANTVKDYLDSAGIKLNSTDAIDNRLIGNRTLFDYFIGTQKNLVIPDSHTIKLDIPYEPYDTQIELYINGIRLSEATGDYSIDKFRSEINLYTFAIDSDDEVTLNLAKGCSHNSRLVKFYDVIPSEVDDENNLIFDINSYGLEPNVQIFYQGLLVPDTEYELFYDVPKMKVKLNNPEEYTILKSNFVLHCLDTTSDYLSANMKTIDISASEILSNHSFRIDLSETEYDPKHDEDVRLYLNGKNISSADFCIDDDILAIVNLDKYVDNVANGLSTLHMFVNSYFMNTYLFTTDGIRIVNQEMCSYRNEDEELISFAIPFIDYDESRSKYMIFKEDGSYVTTRKYYECDDMIRYYPHEEGLVYGDIMNFVMLSEDPTVKVKTKFVKLTEPRQVDIPIKSYDPDTCAILVFTPMGSYISTNRYEIIDTTIYFDDSTSFEIGDEIEFVIMEYTSKLTQTHFQLTGLSMEVSNQLMIPDYTYDKERDNVIIFSENGMYINYHCYNLTSENVIVFDEDFIQTKLGDKFDLLIIRNLTEITNTDSF